MFAYSTVRQVGHREPGVMMFPRSTSSQTFEVGLDDRYSMSSGQNSNYGQNEIHYRFQPGEQIVSVSEVYQSIHC